MTDAPERLPIAVVLAGGASRRMGEDKALVELAGEPAIRRLARGLATLFEALRISVGSREHGERLLDALDDVRRLARVDLAIDGESGRGPLEGVRAALAMLPQGARAFFVSIDTPFVPVQLVRRLWERSGQPSRGAIAESGRGLEPAFAVYSRELLPEIERAMARGDSSLRQMAAWDGVARERIRRPELAPGGFSFNMNDPGELARVRELIESGAAPREALVRSRQQGESEA